VECPACKFGHRFDSGFNGDEEFPTFDKPTKVVISSRQYVCHSKVRDGRIFFFTDSTHELAGKSIMLVPLDA
jgi:hypothetical protein